MDDLELTVVYFRNVLLNDASKRTLKATKLRVAIYSVEYC